MKIFRLLLSFLMVYGLFACHKHINKTMTLLPDDAVVVAFGDSLTEGYGSDPVHAYPNVLSNLINKKVINAGVSGEVSSEGLHRLKEILETYRPQLVILCEGGNDMLHNQSMDELQRNLKQMIAMIKESKAQVVLVGVPTPDFNPLGLLSVDSVFFEVAKSENVPMESKILLELEKDRSRKSDLIHPNAKGYADMAEAIAEFLVDQGAILKN